MLSPLSLVVHTLCDNGKPKLTSWSGIDEMTKSSRMYKLLFISLLFISFKCFAQASAVDLEGTWKIEGKDDFERWVIQPNGYLTGESYRQVGGKKIVLETLQLRIAPEETTYEATVPNQNQGQTVAFKLNPDITTALSFENPNHDFPTKIVYEFKSPQRLFVDVHGKNGKGFSFFMVRVH